MQRNKILLNYYMLYLYFQFGFANIDDTLLNICGNIVLPPRPQASLSSADSAITLILKTNNTQIH